MGPGARLELGMGGEGVYQQLINFATGVDQHVDQQLINFATLGGKC